jgi:(R,R)-butanediol dehydrogenase/meso-butanediol dehydrogenase/diacetyl reductase
MKAAVLEGRRQLTVREVPDPAPGEGDVLVKMRHCGICGSDTHLYDSALVVPGSIMGHEWVGEVVQLGPGVVMWQLGDRVWPGGRFMPGWEWQPEYGWDLGRWAQDDYVRDMGGYGELAVYDQRSLASVPDDLSDIQATMADQAATALGGIQASRLQIGESVLVIGAGPIGLWALRCAQLAGASKVCVAERIKGRGENALAIGADLVVDSNPFDVRCEIAEYFDDTGPDVVLECGGTESALQLAVEVVRPEGRVAVVGISHEPVCLEPLKMYLKGLEMKSVLHIDFKGGMDLIRGGKVDCGKFLTEVIPQREIPEAFERLLNPTDEVKIIVEYAE